MKLYMSLLVGLLVFCATSFAQTSNEKMIFVIDSIPLINDPEEWNEILDEDIADMRIVKNKDSLKMAGFGHFDGVTYIFTKQYRSRPDSIKQIPSLKQMKMENDAWNFYNKPYSGKYIDYYNNGRKQNEGTLLNGKPAGEIKVYFKNGQVGSVTNYRDGIRNGALIEYYKNGSLRQKRYLKDGRDDGVWESYFPDGKMTNSITIKDGKVVDRTIEYYSTGETKKNIPAKAKETINYLMSKVYESLRNGDNKAAIKFCSQITALDSASTDAYSLSGTAMLNESHYDWAIAAFDKALKIEPLTQQALIGRATARVKKHEHTVLKSKEITAAGSKDMVPFSEAEKEELCADLLKADLLQTINLYGYLKSINEIVLKYCHIDLRR